MLVTVFYCFYFSGIGAVMAVRIRKHMCMKEGGCGGALSEQLARGKVAFGTIAEVVVYN